MENGWASEAGEEIENRRGWTYYSEASKRAVCAECAEKGFLKNREIDEDLEEERGWSFLFLVIKPMFHYFFVLGDFAHLNML